MFNSNIGPKWAPLRDIRLQNLGDLDFDLSRSVKVKCDSAIGLPIYGFLLMINSNLWPNTALWRDISLQNMSDLDFDLSRSLKVKSNDAVRLPIYNFLLSSNSKHMPNSYRLGVIATRKIFHYLLSLDPNFATPPPSRPSLSVRFFPKSISSLVQREGLHQK